MIKLRDLVAKLRIVFDKQASTQTEGEASGSLGRISGMAKKLGVAMAAAFAIDKIKDWGVAAAREAMEADKIWNRLDGTLKRAGTSLEEMGGEIRAAARAMQDTTTVDGEQFAETLNELITMTGDYNGSLRNVGVVADLAAAKQIDLQSAAQLVGKAMIGETSTLKRYGIVVEEGADAVEQMRRQFAGAAENEANTFGGKIAQLSNTFGDFKEAVGESLIGLIEQLRVVDILNGALEKATQVIQFWQRVIPGGATGEDLTSTAPDTHGNAGLSSLARRRIAQLRRDEEGRAEREALAKEQAKAAKEAAERDAEAYEQAWNDAWKRTAPSGDRDVIGGSGFQLETPTGVWVRELNEDLPAAMQHAASVWQSTLGLITVDAEVAQEALTSLGIALVTGGAAGVRQLASLKVRENLARAVESTAEGFMLLARGNPGAGLMFKAAAEHAVAAGMWRVLGGVAGGGGGGGGRSASTASYSSSARNMGGGLSREAQIERVTYIVFDPLDPHRTAYQRNVAATGQLAAENFGAMKGKSMVRVPSKGGR